MWYTVGGMWSLLSAFQLTEVRRLTCCCRSAYCCQTSTSSSDRTAESMETLDHTLERCYSSAHVITQRVVDSAFAGPLHNSTGVVVRWSSYHSVVLRPVLFICSSRTTEQVHSHWPCCVRALHAVRRFPPRLGCGDWAPN
ncbi:uncharacterized protein B0H18DRAFT_993841 [Fomitopsis serialis]|uniref:uncharacterized protein n=1 Tax=Fomitopsis serialis TaxID=139415 RepID=UPI0020077AF5|nr:uncharacterized protein B0H18DRAFT_993841 [Neoantrodia serialis]KAH9930219.1 hypothetical protein B0H18DRAFT_993841 [Neoantrodia serialis]